MFGIVAGENAKKNRSPKMKTGTKRSSNGGGGRGGNTKGRSRMEKVRRTRIKTEYLIMHEQKPPLSLEVEAATFTIKLVLLLDVSSR